MGRKLAPNGLQSYRKPVANLQQSSGSVGAKGKPSGNEAATKRERSGSETRPNLYKSEYNDREDVQAKVNQCHKIITYDVKAE
jgi:hypothetical protein